MAPLSPGGEGATLAEPTDRRVCSGDRLVRDRVRGGVRVRVEVGGWDWV